MDLKLWNSDIKHLREIILKSDKLEESKELCLSLHARVHESKMSRISEKTLEDELWEGLDDKAFRTLVNEKGRTVAYGIWHSTRIEDITMNILVADDVQVFNTENWEEKIKTNIVDTGNAMNAEEILQFSKDIDMEELKNYRIAVGRKTRNIIEKLSSTDMKRKFEEAKLQKILDDGAVLNVDASRWLIDFWGRKNVSGIILMTATRHHVVHINEALSAKRKAK